MNEQPNSPIESKPDEALPAPHGALQAEPGYFTRLSGPYLWLVSGLAAVALAFAIYYLFFWPFARPFTGLTYTVKKEILRVTIVERGNLESAENSDIVCRVKAKTQGGTIASTIKWVIDDGTQVKAGDLVVDLDDSGFQEQLKTQKNTVNKARAEWVETKTNFTIQESQNVSDKKTAEVELIQAQLELKKYSGRLAGEKLITMIVHEQVRDYLNKKVGSEPSKGLVGTVGNGVPVDDRKTQFELDVLKESEDAGGKFTSAYLQEVSAYEGVIVQARSDLDNWQDRADWSQRMVKKGFYSLSQADADQNRLESMAISLKKAQGDLDIYRIFEREKNVTKKWSDVKEAERKKDRVETQANSKIEKARADEESKKAIFDQEGEKLRDLMKEEKFYKITAPQDGMVVYYIPDQARFGGGSQQSTVNQGEPVREGQKLIRIPNLAKMMVNTRVHEALVTKIKEEKTRPTGYADALRYQSSIGQPILGRASLYGLAAFQIAFEPIRERKFIKKHDVIVDFPGHSAKIRVDAFPGHIYSGHVKSRATVPAQGDFLSSDVKLYPTMVSIDDLNPKNEELKPGMSAEVTILADETSEPVLLIPIQAVVGNVAMGANRKCFVVDDRGYTQERDIVVGLSNDKLVEIKSGLDEGEKVVLNPRSILPEKSDLKPSTPGGGKRGAEFDEGGAPAKKGKKEGAEKGGGPPPGQNPQMKGNEQRSELAPAVRETPEISSKKG
ncbi:MAG: hypothetical protein FJ303_23555 [Planctomycetes bacterium]|nr:hypothetical protein [Planctomycetota bacterium]